MLRNLLQKTVALGAVFLTFGAAQAQDLPLQPGDVIELGIYGHTELSGERRVDGAGRVLIPTLGRIDAAGMMPDAFEAKVRTELETAELVAQPFVWVDVLRRNDVFVDGDVPSPGAYAWRPGLTVRQLVALAGGSRITNASELGDALSAINATEALLTLEYRIDTLRAQEARLVAQTEFADLLGGVAIEPDRLIWDAMTSATDSAHFSAMRDAAGRLRLIRFPSDIAERSDLADIRRTQQDLLESRIAMNLATLNSLKLGIQSLHNKKTLLDQELVSLSETIGRIQARVDDILKLKDSGLVRSQVVLDLQTALSQAQTSRLAILNEQADTEIEIQRQDLALANFSDTIRREAGLGLEAARRELSVSRARLAPVRRAAAIAGTMGATPVAIDRNDLELRVTLSSDSGPQDVSMSDPVLPGQSLTITRVTPGE